MEGVWTSFEELKTTRLSYRSFVLGCIQLIFSLDRSSVEWQSGFGRCSTGTLPRTFLQTGNVQKVKLLPHGIAEGVMFLAKR